MRNLLIPVDFSDVTGEVVKTAASLAGALGSRLYVMHVAPPDPDFVGYEVEPEVGRDLIAKKLRSEHRRLQKIADQLRGQHIDTQGLLIQGPTVEMILGQANKLQADLIVMGSHGHNPLYRALLGSTSQGVIQKACCPVVVIPKKRVQCTQ